jgi:hypothetical protein
MTGAPKLAPPGAGLPPLEMFLQRHIFFPLFVRSVGYGKALEYFLEESKLLRADVEGILVESRDVPILVPRLPAIEDSSRNWSATMVLEHLIIVGDRIALVFQSLAAGQVPPGKADTAAVKPEGSYNGSNILEKYDEFVRRYRDIVSPVVEARRGTRTVSGAKFDHPWFGPMDEHQWLVLAALHQRIHRRQIAEIIKGLK